MRNIRRILKSTGSEKGQGTLEYILVLFVSILIILGGVYQVNDAFKNWAENYFGEYLACLLETGELPAIGGSGGTAGICNESFEEFTFANGRPLIGDPIGAGGGAGRGGPGDDNNSSGGGGDDLANRPGQAAGSGGIGRRGSRFRPSGGGSGGGAGSRGVAGANGGNNSDTGGDGVLNVSQSNRRGRKGRVPINREVGGFAYGRTGAKEKEEKEKKTAVKKGFDKEKVVRKKLVKVAAASTATEEVPEIEGYTFGNWLRYLIIAGILIALLLLLGGQALQIGKSMDG